MTVIEKKCLQRRTGIKAHLLVLWRLGLRVTSNEIDIDWLFDWHLWGASLPHTISLIGELLELRSENAPGRNLLQTQTTLARSNTFV